ncbi:hypothetical protein GCM10025880_66190 [Methylorubrum aminovorans]|nr:hypothetical protein GCM10025880_66190 [Methylorubrum aminovorans]
MTIRSCTWTGAVRGEAQRHQHSANDEIDSAVAEVGRGLAVAGRLGQERQRCTLEVEHILWVTAVKRVPAVGSASKPQRVEADDAPAECSAPRGHGAVDLTLGIEHDRWAAPALRLGEGEIGDEQTRGLALARRRDGDERALYRHAHRSARVGVAAKFEAAVQARTLGRAGEAR